MQRCVSCVRAHTWWRPSAQRTVSILAAHFSSLWKAGKSGGTFANLPNVSSTGRALHLLWSVCVTFTGCHILGTVPSSPPRGLAWRSRSWAGGGASGSSQALCQPPDNCQQRERGTRGWQNLSLTDRWAPSHRCGIVAGRRAGKLRCTWGGGQSGEAGWGRQAETDNEGRAGEPTEKQELGSQRHELKRKKNRGSLSKTGGEEPETEREPQTQKEESELCLRAPSHH